MARMRIFGMRNKKSVASMLLMLFLLSAVIAAFHYHCDDSPHHDCPLCVAGNHLSAADLSGFTFETHTVVSIGEIPEEQLLYNSARFTLLPCRAPPA